MPLYEYECFVCQNRFERIRRVAEASGVDCPECGGKVRRLLSAPALQFKGSGWYVNDYGKGNGGPSTALAKKEDTPPPPPKKSDASDTKAAKKASESS